MKALEHFLALHCTSHPQLDIGLLLLLLLYLRRCILYKWHHSYISHHYSLQMYFNFLSIKQSFLSCICFQMKLSSDGLKNHHLIVLKRQTKTLEVVTKPVFENAKVCPRVFWWHRYCHSMSESVFEKGFWECESVSTRSSSIAIPAPARFPLLPAIGYWPPFHYYYTQQDHTATTHQLNNNNNNNNNPPLRIDPIYTPTHQSPHNGQLTYKDNTLHYPWNSDIIRQIIFWKTNLIKFECASGTFFSGTYPGHQ